MNPGSVSDQAVEQLSREKSGEWEAERGYCSGLAVVGGVSSHSRDSVEELGGSCVAGCSCDHPWPVERQAGGMTGLKNRGSDSAAFQESMLVDPVCSGHQAERGDRGDSFGH